MAIKALVNLESVTNSKITSNVSGDVVDLSAANSAATKADSASTRASSVSLSAATAVLAAQSSAATALVVANSAASAGAVADSKGESAVVLAVSAASSAASAQVTANSAASAGAVADSKGESAVLLATSAASSAVAANAIAYSAASSAASAQVTANSAASAAVVADSKSVSLNTGHQTKNLSNKNVGSVQNSDAVLRVSTTGDYVIGNNIYTMTASSAVFALPASTLTSAQAIKLLCTLNNSGIGTVTAGSTAASGATVLPATPAGGCPVAIVDIACGTSSVVLGTTTFSEITSSGGSTVITQIAGVN